MPIILPPLVGSLVPTTSFASMVPESSAFLPGCPSLVIERTIRKMAIDLCQRGRVWVTDASTITFTPAEYRYPLYSSQPEAEPIDVESGFVVSVAGAKTKVNASTLSKIRVLFPQWPQAGTGTPVLTATPNPGLVQFCPTPDAADVAYLRVFTRPTPDADNWPSWLAAEYGRCVFHGVLHELMAMPERSWTDAKMADYHGKQWTYLLAQATIRADQEYNTDSQAVEMRPFA